MKIPESLLDSLQGVTGFERESFVKVHQHKENNTSIRLNNFKVKDASSTENEIVNRPHFLKESKVNWTNYGYYLKERPSFTFDPLFHAGCYYVQEASSMFLEQAFKQLTDLHQPIKVLDACAAPGGKSTHILSLISQESILVSNEVIKTRSHILGDNIIKWGCANGIVTNNDPSSFKKIPGYFDVIVVDAPCSGSGLFRRDAEAIHEWSLNNVQLCCQRQQRILADVLPSLKENGLLIYSTCSYSKEENEDIAEWLINEMEMINEPLKISDEWNIVKTLSGSGTEGYRFYPDKLKGEGFFLSCFRNQARLKESRKSEKFREKRSEHRSPKNKAVISHWMNTDELELLEENGQNFACTDQLIKQYSFLKTVLNCNYKGINIGQVIKDKLIPDHAMAMSHYLSYDIPALDLDYNDSIKYLQRQELGNIPGEKGWHLARYNKYGLGWVNVLENRLNNYYPKELRILKQTVKSR